jgi:hypothetical protein
VVGAVNRAHDGDSNSLVRGNAVLV